MNPQTFIPVGGAVITWQPPDGWDIRVGDPGTEYMPLWNPAVNASPPRVPAILISTETSAALPDARDARIAALEREVTHLRHECKRLTRQLAQMRGRHAR